MNKPYIFLLGLAVSLCACDPGRVYEENIDVDDAIWKLDDVKRFQFSIDDNSQAYDLQFNIRNTLAYPFQNIYIQYNLRDSSDNVLESELVQYYLFDPKSGEPQGDGMGDLFDNRFDMLTDYRFPYPGQYSMELQQFMRLDSLPMVVSVGLRVALTEGE